MTEPTLDSILRATACACNLDPDAILGRCRRYSIVRARHVFAYLARELTTQSLPEIGRFYGRHHATVLNSVQAVLENESLRRLASSVARLVRQAEAA